MAPVLLFGALPASNEKARADIIAGLGKIADYAEVHDPETTKHATFLSLDPADPLTVYAIEEYTSQAACEAHMKWPAVLEVLESWKTDPGRLSGPPEIWHSNHVIQSFTRQELAKAENPFVVLAKLQYDDEASLNESLVGWERVVGLTKENENGTLTYAIGKDVEHQNRLTFVEAYESEAYLKEVHMNTKALQEKLVEEERLRTKAPHVVMLKKVVGYLHK